MDDFLILLLMTCLCHVISTQSDVRLPPCITRGPREKNILYKRGEALTLECIAEGTPAVRYEWKKNGLQLNTSLSDISKGSDGTITINRAAEMDEGYYQCFARNLYGTALSNIMHARIAFLNFTTGSPTVNRKTVVEGMPFHIQADRERSFPKPRFDWDKAYDIDSIFTPLWTSRRIQFAENGDLHFAYALREDGEKILSCSIENTFLERQTRGCYTNVTVTRNLTGIGQFAPTLAFSSETQTVALIGESVKLSCFFYGRPEPTISWTRPGHLPTGRYLLGIYNIELTINNITASDEADYICTASNNQGRREHSLQIRVEAKPEFNNTMDRPHNVNVTEGESVTFNCNPFAKPQAEIVWLQNGHTINTENPPERFVFSSDNKSLTIRDVCRDCVDGESKTDLMVIQCNASNAHGYVFASGYLNVLMKTTVTIGGSRNVHVDFLEEKQFIFQCYATSDPSTPPTVRWYKLGDLVRDEPPYISVENKILIIRIEPNCSKYLGEYICIGDNGYSRDNQTITLSYQDRPTTVEHITETITKNVFTADIKKSVFTEDITKNVFTDDITMNAFTEDITRNKETWEVWKIILVAAAIIGLVLFLIGIFLDYRWKRHFRGVNKETVERRIPNPDGIYEDIGYDSIGFHLEEIEGNNDRSVRRESGEYDHIGYDSVDQILDEIGNREDAMTHSPDVHGRNRHASLDAPQSEAMDRGRQMLDKDITCDDPGYSMPMEEDANGEGEDQQQINGYESVQSESVKCPKSNDQSESSNTYSDLNREEVNPHLDLGTADVNPEETNSHSDLDPKEVNQYLDLVSNEVNQNLDLDPKEASQYLDLVSNEGNSYLDLDPKEVNQYLDLVSNEVNPYLDLDQKEVNQYLELDSEPIAVTPNLDLSPKELNQYLDLDPKEVAPGLNLGRKEVNQYLDLDRNKVNHYQELDPVRREVNQYMGLGIKEVNPYLDLGLKEVNSCLDLGPKEVSPYLEPVLKKVDP